MIMKKIGSVKFNLLGPELVRKMSGIEIKTPETYDKDGYPMEGGLMDPHLGVINPGIKCKTCGQGMRNCSGHFGHLELERPVMHSEFGRIYFIDEKSKSRKKALRLFSDLVRHNKQGLLISTDHPNQIRQKYQLEKTPVIWLSDSIEMEKNNIKTNELEALNNTIHLFLERANTAIVAIDGIEKLIVVNGSRKVTNFFDSLTKKAIETNSTIFFSVSDTEKNFVKIYNDIIVIKKTLKDLENKLLSRKISNEAYSEVLIENWEELIEKEAELKIFEDELIGKISDTNSIKLQLFIEQKALTIANYYIAKRKIDTKEGNEIVNNINKKIIRLEKEIRKEQNSY